MALDVALEVGRLYEPINRIANLFEASVSDIFIKLPGIVGYYPMSMVTDAGDAVNHVQPGIDVFQVGTVPLADDGNTYRHTGNGTNYLRRTGQFALTGTEAWVAASLRGSTVGGWFMIDSLPPNQGGLISRDGVASDRGYSLSVSSAAIMSWSVSSNGAAQFNVFSLAVTLGAWHFVVGRFIPSTELAIFVDGDKTTNTIAIPAASFVSSQDFEIGRKKNDDARVTHAKVRDVFICQTALSDTIIENIRASSGP